LLSIRLLIASVHRRMVFRARGRRTSAPPARQALETVSERLHF